METYCRDSAENRRFYYNQVSPIFASAKNGKEELSLVNLTLF